MDRRTSLKTLSAGLAALFVGTETLLASLAAPKRRMTIYKSPTCGCCSKWVDHVRAAGFEVKTVDVDDVTPFKKKLGVPLELASCHTGVVGEYAFEGHVPADLVERFLRTPPKDARGLAVPGMPVGSPGMEVGTRKDRYDVVLFTRTGRRSVYARR